MNVRFIDTSIMTNLLNIPSRNQNADIVRKEFKDAMDLGERLILPISTIIETGNHIAHIADGNVRRTIAVKFSKYLHKTVEDAAPWYLYGNELSKDDLKYIADQFPQKATEQVGLGDLSIIRYYCTYKETVPCIGKIMIWSVDTHLQGYQEDLTGTTRRRSQ